MSLAMLLWIALLQAFVPAGQLVAHADYTETRSPRAAAAVLATPQLEQPVRVAPRPGRSVRAAPAFAERHRAPRASLANVAAHPPRQKGGLPRGMSVGSSGTKTGTGWALVPGADSRADSRECGTEDTAADRTSRVAAARGRLLSYLPNPPPFG